MRKRHVVTMCIVAVVVVLVAVVLPLTLATGGSPGCEGDLWSDFRCFR